MNKAPLPVYTPNEDETMSALLQIIDLSFSRSHQTLFQQFNLTINQNDRIGLVGHNGCGKSSLLSIIRGIEELDSGEIRKPRGLNIGWVEQFIDPTLLEKNLLQAVVDVLEPIDIATLGWMAKNQLLSLGFSENQFVIPVKNLSGGQQNLLLIARALLLEPELLLMDEPGNHMDIFAMSRLEKFLARECKCPFMIISHDQHLLNNVCNKTVFIRDQQSYEYALPFDGAREKLREHDKHAERHLQLEEKEIKRLQTTAKRLAIWGREHDNESLSRKAKNIEKRAEKLSNEKTKVTDGPKLNVRLDNLNLAAKQILTIESAAIFTPDLSRKLLAIEHIVIQPGDRVALLGINGVGKSSTLEAIRAQFVQNENHSGSIRFNPRATLGYYDQSLNTLNAETSRSDWLRNNTQGSEHGIKKTLINAGISFEDFSRPVNSLSGGEKARMMFMAFELNQPNLMILDEPTNHIDLYGKQQLGEQLKESGATLIITSHDRHFLEQIATRWLWITDGKIEEINGSERFYQNILDQGQSLSSSNQPEKTASGTASIDVSAFNLSDNKATDPKDEDAILQRIEWLDVKLGDDKRRKQKFQKPELQIEWQRELDELWSLLQ